jgi:hypothetical protein
MRCSGCVGEGVEAAGFGGLFHGRWSQGDQCQGQVVDGIGVADGGSVCDAELVDMAEGLAKGCLNGGVLRCTWEGASSVRS